METRRQKVQKEINELKIKETGTLTRLRVIRLSLAAKEAALKKLPLDAKEELAKLEAEECAEVMYAVNPEKGTVVAAAVTSIFERLTVASSECHPDDIFNETVGKLIALKRALGIKFDATVYGEEREELRGCDNCKYSEVFVGDLPCVLCADGDQWTRRVK